MRWAVLGVGVVLLVLGLIQLIITSVAAGGIRAQVGGVDQVVTNATGTITQVAGALDGGVTFLKGLDPQLASIEETTRTTLDGIAQTLDSLDANLGEISRITGRTLDDSIRFVGDLRANLTQVQQALDQTRRGVETFSDGLINTITFNRDLLRQQLSAGVVQIRPEDLRFWASQIELAGFQDPGLQAWADFLAGQGVVVRLFPLRLTADDMDFLAQTAEASGLDATFFRSWAAFLRANNMVIRLTPDDVAASFNPLVDNVRFTARLVSDPLAATTQTLSTATQVLDATRTTLADLRRPTLDSISQARTSLAAARNGLDALKGTALTTLSNARNFLKTAETNLGAVRQNLQATADSLQAANISGLVDRVIGFLQTFMLINSILFIATGLGLVLTGLALRPPEAPTA